MPTRHPELEGPLFHGSTVEVRKVDLAQGEADKDFGRGFYATSDKGQAEKFAVIKARRERAAAGRVSVFSLSDAKGLRIL